MTYETIAERDYRLRVSPWSGTLVLGCIWGLGTFSERMMVRLGAKCPAWLVSVLRTFTHDSYTEGWSDCWNRFWSFDVGPECHTTTMMARCSPAYSVHERFGCGLMLVDLRVARRVLCRAHTA